MVLYIKNEHMIKAINIIIWPLSSGVTKGGSGRSSLVMNSVIRGRDEEGTMSQSSASTLEYSVTIGHIVVHFLIEWFLIYHYFIIGPKTMIDSKKFKKEVGNWRGHPATSVVRPYSHPWLCRPNCFLLLWCYVNAVVGDCWVFILYIAIHITFPFYILLHDIPLVARSINNIILRGGGGALTNIALEHNPRLSR